MKARSLRVVNAMCFLAIAALMEVGLIVLLPTLPAYASTFVVDSTADTADANPGDGACGDSSGNCSLRAAISEANALAGADTITLPAGTYTLTRAGTGDDVNATGDLDATSEIIINGAGAAATIIQAGDRKGVVRERV